MTELSLCMPYWCNPTMLAFHLRVFMQEWSPDLRKRVEVVVVDDCSEDEPAAPVIREAWARGGDQFLTLMPKLRVYRMKERRIWGQHACRNVAAYEADSPWLLCTDVDHICPPSTLEEVLRRLPTMRSREVLTFARVDAPKSREWRASEWRGMEPTRREDGTLKWHVNSFTISKKRFFKIGAYDERFVLAGLYGTDQDFRTRLHGNGAVTHHLADTPLIRVSREVIADASTRGVERKTPGRTEVKKIIAARREAEGGAPLVLSFPFERVI